jgi:hypothetical protein
MTQKYEYLNSFNEKIKILDQTANELLDMGEKKEIPAIYENTRRILALVNLLKINVSDVLEFEL